MKTFPTPACGPPWALVPAVFAAFRTLSDSAGFSTTQGDFMNNYLFGGRYEFLLSIDTCPPPLVFSVIRWGVRFCDTGSGPAITFLFAASSRPESFPKFLVIFFPQPCPFNFVSRAFFY